MGSTRLTTKIGLALLLVGAIALSAPAKAEAAFVAWICNDAACSGGDDLMASDGGAGDSSALAGVILFNPAGGYNGYELTVNTSQSKPALTSGMDLSYVVSNLDNGTGGSIWLYAVDTDFVGGSGQIGGDLGGTQPSGTTTTAYICDGDANVGDWSPCSSDSTSSSPLVGISLSHLISANPYALTIGVQISGLGVGTTATGDFRVIPEPATMALFGMGLAGLGLAGRRRRARK